MQAKPGMSLTYSPAVTLVPTNECFNLCSYCNFRRDPDEAQRLKVDEAKTQLDALQGSGVSEILVLSGEVHPQSSRRKAWFQDIYDLCQLILDFGFLPHSNVGPLTFDEMSLLAQVNVSMGLMLEQQRDLPAHRLAPSKVPSLRLEQLEWAGQLQIPFTTGLLLGIGESERDWSQSLKAIASVHRSWGHIQEVILQPYQPGRSEIQPHLGFDGAALVKVVTLAREILPSSIKLQIPPNLITSRQTLKQCIESGATDLGGLVPHDFVNPDYDHLPFAELMMQLESWGYQLQPRLPLYEEFYSRISQPLQHAIAPWLEGARKWGY